MNQISTLPVLVTGATGLVGAHLCAALLKEGYTVKAIKRSTSQLDQFKFVMHWYGIDQQLLNQRFQWSQADIFNTTEMREALKGVSQVYHCAAEVNLAAVSEEQMIKTNVKGTIQLLELAKQALVKKFCYMSSISSLGHSIHGEDIDEDSPTDPNSERSVYGRSKKAAETEVLQADSTLMQTVVVCPGVILAPSIKKQSSAQIIFLAKNGVPIISSGGSGYVDVRDVCHAMIGLMQSPKHGERFVVVGKNIRLYELFKLLSKGFGKPVPLLLPDWMILLGGSVSGWVSKCLHRTPRFDRQMAQTAINYNTYSSEKLLKAIPFTFTPIEQTVADICDAMRSNAL